MAGYIFGGSTGDTAESIARKRKIAESLRSRGRAPQNLGEGLSSFGGDIAAALMGRQADKREKEGRAAYAKQWGDTLNPKTAPIENTDDLWNRATGAGVGPKPNPTLAQLTQLAGNDFANPMQQQILSALIGKKLDPQTGKPLVLSPGSIAVDPQTGKQIAAGAPKPQSINDRAVAAYMAANPGATEFDAMAALKKAGASRNTTVVKPSAGETAFDKGVGSFQANLYGGLVEDGFVARDQLSNVNRLDALLENQQGGLKSWLSAAGARMGVELDENANEAQAAEALIAKLVPAQRVPGSGTTSDFDAKNFAKSMPSLWGLPGGNRLITETMRKALQHRVKRADIASAVMVNEIDRAEGLRQLQALPSPWPSREEIAAIQRQKRQDAAADPATPRINSIRGAGTLFKYQGPQ